MKNKKVCENLYALWMHFWVENEKIKKFVRILYALLDALLKNDEYFFLNNGGVFFFLLKCTLMELFF